MTRTKEEYDSMNAKMTYAKGQITRYYNSIITLCARLQTLTAKGEGNFQEKTAKKIAVDIDKMRTTMEKKMESLEVAGTNLMGVIVEMNATDTELGSLDKMAAKG